MRKPKATGVQKRLLEYFDRAEGRTVHLADLHAAFGDLDEATIQRGVNNMKPKIKALGGRLEVVMRGQAWRFDRHPKEVQGAVVQREQAFPVVNGKSLDVIFKGLGTTREGDLILQSADGRLFRAREL